MTFSSSYEMLFRKGRNAAWRFSVPKTDMGDMLKKPF